MIIRAGLDKSGLFWVFVLITSDWSIVLGCDKYKSHTPDWADNILCTLTVVTTWCKDRRTGRERETEEDLHSVIIFTIESLENTRTFIWSHFNANVKQDSPLWSVLSVTIRLKCFNLNVENNKNNFLTRGFTGSELNQLNIQIFSSVGYKLFTISTFSFTWK